MTNIKERVLLIAESKGIHKVEFFKELGLSYANFKGVQKSSALGSDAIATILTKFEDINPEWLVVGSGDMSRDQEHHHHKVAITLPSKIDQVEPSPLLIAALEKVISAQQATIQSQEITIAALSAHMDNIEKKKKGKKKQK